MNTAPPTLDASNFPETSKFLKWYEDEQSKGLQDIKFSAGNLEGATLETFFSEVNEALNAETVPDNDLF